MTDEPSASADAELAALVSPELGLSLLSLPAETGVVSFWDCPDSRLAAHGHKLRCVAAGAPRAWVLSAAEGGEAWVETAEPSVPDRHRRLLVAVVDDAPLVPSVTVRIRRQRHVLLDANGLPAGHIDDERTEVDERWERSVALTPVRVSLPPDVDDALRRLRRRVNALAHSGGGIIDVKEPEGLSRSSTLYDVVAASLQNGLYRWLRNDPGVRLGQDDECLHQVRVALRRLRSDLRTFRPVLDPEWADAMREQLAEAGAAIGPLRDLDVLAGRLARHAAGAHLDPEVTRHLLESLAMENEALRARLIPWLESPAYLAAVRRLRAAVDSVAWGPGVDPSQPAKFRARDLVRGAHARVDSLVGRIDALLDTDGPDAVPDEILHRLRRRIKQARYAAEAMAPLFGRGMRRRIDALVLRQERLGELQDGAVATEWLLTRRGEARDERDRTLIDALLGLEHTARDALRGELLRPGTGLLRTPIASSTG